MKKEVLIKYILLPSALITITNSALAHSTLIDLEKMSKSDTVVLYLQTGFQHIIPAGLDHILFVLSLFLLSPQLKTILYQVTTFTIAHTITLGLSMYQIVKVPSNIVEPLISISIIYVALENIYTQQLKKTRIGIIFLFGLIHGMGFAGALSEIGLPQKAYFISLITFNIGIELGQIMVILIAYTLVAKWVSQKQLYRSRIVVPISAMICIVALIWTVQRLFI